jgi:hypothetical protein
VTPRPKRPVRTETYPRGREHAGDLQVARYAHILEEVPYFGFFFGVAVAVGVGVGVDSVDFGL